MDTLHAIFKEIPSVDFSMDMEGRISRAIEGERVALEKGRNRIFFAGFALSAVGLFVATLWHGSALIESDFWSMTALLFSDADVVMAHGSAFLFSLLETFPVIPAVVLLAPVFVLLLLAEEYAKLDGAYHRYTYNSSEVSTV
jgi:hypothetical protein